MRYSVFYAVAAGVMPFGAAQAAPVLDQSNVVGPPNLANGAFSFGSGSTAFHRYQTLTVGITGKLTEVDVQYNTVYGNPNMTGAFNVYGTDAGGVPNATLLGIGTLGTIGGGWVSFLMNIGVTAGQVIAVEPFYTGSGAGWSYTVGASTYAGGTGFDRSGTGAIVTETVDYGFRTYVDATGAVPEPATWAMMVAGFGVAGGAMRRRRHFGVRYA